MRVKSVNNEMATPTILDTAYVADNAPTSDRRIGRIRLMWRAILTFAGIGGVGCGITSLILSGLTFLKLVDARSGVRIAVPVLIVICLSLLMLAAHAMDRLRDLNSGT